MRTIPVLSIVHTPVSGPAYIEIAGNLTALFHGREWIDPATGTRYPYYTYTSVPYGIKPLQATTFSLNENELYDGNYTVYTKQSAGDFEPVEFVGGNTRIRIVQTISTDGTGSQLTTGTIYNISTYLLDIVGEADELVLETQLIDDRPLELVGRNFSGWGEILHQNQLKLVQNFASDTAPTNPFIGQLWFNSATNILSIYNSTWVPINLSIIGLMYRHTQDSASLIWTINHNIGERIVDVQVFKNTGLAAPNDVKMIFPNDVTFNSATQVTVTFSNAESGYAIIRG